MRHELTREDADRGRQASTERRKKHDRKCRQALERAARSTRPTIATGKRYLQQAGVSPPRGGEWHTGQVWRIAKHLGIKLGIGLRPGVLLYCRRCRKGRRNLSQEQLCRTCHGVMNRARLNRGIRKAELADARMKAAYYAEKVKVLEAGGRMYPGGFDGDNYRLRKKYAKERVTTLSHSGEESSAGRR